MSTDTNSPAPSPDQRGDRPPAWSSLASKLILFVFASTFITATAVSWISIRSASGSLRDAIERLYPLSLDHAAQRLEPWVCAIRLQLEYNARRRAAQPSVLAGLGDRELFDGLALYDRGARQDAWGVAPAEAREALQAPNRIAAVRLPDGGWALAIAPKQSSSGSELVAVVSLARLVPLLEVELPNEDTLLALVDGGGRVLARVGNLPGGAPFDRIPVNAFHSRGALRDTEISGEHVIAATQPVAVLDWNVAIVAPFETAYAPVLSVVKRVFAIDLGIILAFGLIAYRITARVVRPIGHLSEAVRRVMLGHSEIEIPEVSSRDEIGLLTRTFNDMIQHQRAQREEIEEANRHLKDRNQRLQQANEILNQLSITDGLTKLHNHRFFQDHLTREIRRVERTQEPLAILVIDIDDFKRLNDRLGHAAGDEILVRIAQILNGAVRGSDLCARYGGEEFVILAPTTDAPGAYLLAEKVRTAIAESSFIVDDSLRPLRVTVSVGVAAFNGNRKRFFQKADQALYRAKADGKNCVVVHEDDVPEVGTRA
ncbi:MAG TPA: diguanylate cyclase [Myxococcota bacterium]|nr:diguanylate cyclase [Myxococcota bacterium]